MFKNIFLVLIFIVLVGALFFVALRMGVVGTWLQREPTTGTVTLPTFIQDAFKPKGYLLMNLRSGEDNEMGFYTVSVQDGGRATRAPVTYVWPSEASKVNVGVASGVFSQEGKQVSGIFKIGEGVQELVYASSTLGYLTTSPKISSSGRWYVFSVSPITEDFSHDELFNPRYWSLYLGDMEGGDPRFITHGSAAHFSPDETKLLYLAADGFHVYDIASGSDVFIPELATELPLSYYMADISRDGKRLVVTSSPNKEVRVGNILSWEPFKIEWTHRFPILAYWPVFSPDGDYLALMNFDWIDNEPGNRRVLITDLRTNESQVLENLGEYTGSEFFISDWVE